MATNRAKVAARERARRRRLELDAERARRDEQIEQAGAEFFQAQESYRVAAAQMGAAVTTLESLGESSQRIQLLLEISTADLRRVRQVGRVATASGSTVEAGSGGGEGGPSRAVHRPMEARRPIDGSPRAGRDDAGLEVSS